MSVYLPKIDDYILDQESLQVHKSPPKKKTRIKPPSNRHAQQLPTHDEQVEEHDEILKHQSRLRDNAREGAEKDRRGRVGNHPVRLPDIRLSNGHAPSPNQSSSSSPRSSSGQSSRRPVEDDVYSGTASYSEDGERSSRSDKKRVAFEDAANDANEKEAILQTRLIGEFHDALSPLSSPRSAEAGSDAAGRSASLNLKGGAGQPLPSPRDVPGISPRELAALRPSRKLRLKRKSSRFWDRFGFLAAATGVGADGVYRGPLTTPAQARRKFSQAIKAVISLRKLATILIKKSEEPSAMLKTFTDIIDMSDDFSESLKNQGLSFDPSYFKANKEISISSEVKNILNLSPESRTPEQIQTAIYGLQSLPSFAEYPLHMQEKLAKVAWYEVVPPKRTIIRQGHYAENFYFILSGQAVVTILIRDPKTNEAVMRTANFMRKGTSFGELALLHHSRRTATVTSQDTVQLLSIGREDFFDIFMASHTSDQVPEHIRFISQLDFMKGWPLERLREHPQHCLLHFFKRNMVIVKDSRQSDWLYIIKSGSCQVLKQLRGVTAKLGYRKHEATLDESDHLLHTGTSVRGPKVDTGLHKPRPRWHKSGVSLDEAQAYEEEGSKLFAPADGKGGKSAARHPTMSVLRALPPLKMSSSTPSLSSALPLAKNGKRFSVEKYSADPVTGKAHLEASTPRLQHLAGHRKQRPASLPLETRTPRRGEAHPTPSAPPPPVFVQVANLKPRDVFGLEMVRFHASLDTLQTSVSLVSQGAECIMLSKDFFRKHATDFVKANLQDIVRPYPDEYTFQESLQRKADWELFKHTLIDDITSWS